MRLAKIALAAVAALIADVAAASPAATQDWVIKYVATNENVAGSIVQSVTNGVSTLIGFGDGGTNDWVMMTSEYPDKLALVATNVTSLGATMGVTNGMTFAWDGNGDFWNSPAGLVVQCVSNECFAFSGNKSVLTNGVDTFIGYFGVYGTKITWSESAALLPGNQSRSKSVWEMFIDMLIPSASADTWMDLLNEGRWFDPNTKGDAPANYPWKVEDKSGNVVEIDIGSDRDGNRYITNPEAVERLASSVKSVMQNMAGLSVGLTEAYDATYRIDAQIDEILGNLNKIFNEAWAKMDKIDSKMSQPTDSGESREVVVQQKIVEKTKEKIVVQGGVAALLVDGKSIGVVNTDKGAGYQIKGFDNASTGRMPFKVGTGLGWTYPISTWFDNAYRNDATSIGVSYDPSTGMPSNKDGRHGVHIAGWYSPASGVHQCTDKLSDLLSAQGKETHYVLTKYIGSGSGSGALHYTPVGTLSNLVGNASIRFVGTDGSSGGPANAKTTVTFASASDSNVGVAIGGSNTNITITIGVYWKD